MVIKELNRSKALEAMKNWTDSYPDLPAVDPEYEKVRKDLQEFAGNVSEGNINKSDYYTDVHMGLHLYDYLWKQKGFTMRVAANDNFWRYMSIKVVPDIVAERWGYDNESHYWSKPSRIWLRQIWWYVHLSWQGNIKSTEQILESGNFSTDTILNLEERTGRNGTYIDVYRMIMYFYGNLPASTIDEFNKRIRKNDKHATLFRTIMKLNTAKSVVIDPALYLGGTIEYVKSLYTDAGVRM